MKYPEVLLCPIGMNPTKKKSLTSYKVTMSSGFGAKRHTGDIIFIKSKNKHEAWKIALEEKEKQYGEGKGTIESITEVTKQDIEDLPIAFDSRILKKMERTANPGTKTIDKRKVIRSKPRNPIKIKSNMMQVLVPIAVIGILVWLISRKK